jgi:toxin HigB-1
VAIRSYRGKWAEQIHVGRDRPKRFPADLVHVARRRLVQLNRAARLDDLRAPPGNRLEPLRGDLAGRYSIRINDQWRIVFRWTTEGPCDVEIIDYH